jgi:hypothetical protein
MARAQRPQEALPTPRACKRPERSGGPGRRKNLERRWRRGREEAGMPAGEILLPDGLWAAPAGSSALQSRQGRLAEPPRKATVGSFTRRQTAATGAAAVARPSRRCYQPEWRRTDKHPRSVKAQPALVKPDGQCRASQARDAVPPRTGHPGRLTACCIVCRRPDEDAISCHDD